MTRELLSFTSVNQPRGFLERRSENSSVPQYRRTGSVFLCGGKGRSREGRKSHFGLWQLKIWGIKATPTPCHSFQPGDMEELLELGTQWGPRVSHQHHTNRDTCKGHPSKGHTSKCHPSESHPSKGRPSKGHPAVPLARTLCN